MTPPTKRRKKKSSGSRGFWIFAAIIIVIAIISVLLSYWWVGGKESDERDVPAREETTEPHKESGTKQQVDSPIDGTWVSNYDGAMLTLSGDTYSIELPGIDESGKAVGSFTLEENICTFLQTSEKAVCKDMEGHYLYTLADSGELSFSLIKDNCKSRKDRMTTSWFRLE